MDKDTFEGSGVGFLAFPRFFVIMDHGQQRIIICHGDRVKIFEIKEGKIKPDQETNLFGNSWIYSAVRALEIDVEGMEGSPWYPTSNGGNVRFVEKVGEFSEIECFVVSNENLLLIFQKGWLYQFGIKEQKIELWETRKNDPFADKTIRYAVDKLEITITGVG